MATFSEKMDDAMREQGITTTELAKRLGVTPASVSQYRHGRFTPRGKRKQAIISLLSLDISDQPERTKVRKVGVIRAARVLGVSRDSLRHAIEQGAFPWAKFWMCGDRPVYWIDADRMQEDMGVRVD